MIKSETPVGESTMQRISSSIPSLVIPITPYPSAARYAVATTTFSVVTSSSAPATSSSPPAQSSSPSPTQSPSIVSPSSHSNCEYASEMTTVSVGIADEESSSEVNVVPSSFTSNPSSAIQTSSITT